MNQTEIASQQVDLKEAHLNVAGAVQSISSGSVVKVDPKYGQFFSILATFQGGKNKGVWTNITLPIHERNVDGSTIYLVDFQDHKLKGQNVATATYNGIFLGFQLCIDGPKCATKQEMIEFRNTHAITWFYNKTLLDLNNQDRPVQYDVLPLSSRFEIDNEQDSFPLFSMHATNLQITNRRFLTPIYQNPDISTTFHNLFFSGSYYQLTKDEIDPALVAGCFLETGDSQTIASRQAYSFLDCLSDIGGISGIIIPVMNILLNTLYSPFKYTQAILDSMFIKEKKSRNQELRNEYQTRINKMQARKNEWSATMQANQALPFGEQDIIQIFKIFESRKRMKVSFCKLFCRLENLPLISTHCLKRKFVEEPQNDTELYDKGSRMIEQALDIRNLIKTQQDLQILANLLLNKHQKWLFDHSRKRLLTQTNTALRQDYADLKMPQEEEIHLMLNEWQPNSNLDFRLLKQLY